MSCLSYLGLLKNGMNDWSEGKKKKKVPEG
jgi:hypothetical protein